MKIKMFALAAFICLGGNIEFLKAQYGKVEEVSVFGKRLKNPIEMDVQLNQDKLTFNVINKSYYPYEVEIRFDHLTNLSPSIVQKKIVADPGTNRFLVLNIIDKNQPPDYSYSLNYIMGSAEGKSNAATPYLMPIGEYKTVKLAGSNGSGESGKLENHFKMNQGDTVFCIRKGYVTALPDNEAEVDRIMQSSTLEIRHLDGTVAVYGGIDLNVNFVKLGQIVYPGQAIGKIGSSETLILNLFEFQGKGQLKNLDIYYVNPEGKLISSKNILNSEVGYPESIIKIEMSKKEISKYDKGTLY